jgi:hypothetical protein
MNLKSSISMEHQSLAAQESMPAWAGGAAFMAPGGTTTCLGCTCTSCCCSAATADAR